MMSTPLTTSGLSVEASTSCGRTMAGRRLAKRPRDLRIFRRPVSGLLSRGLPSHLGPPIAANITESDAFIIFSVCGCASRFVCAFMRARMLEGGGTRMLLRSSMVLNAGRVMQTRCEHTRTHRRRNLLHR